MPKTFLELKGMRRSRPRRESLLQAIPSQLDEIRETKTGEDRKRAERRWARIAISTAMELRRRKKDFDDGYVKSLRAQLKSRGSLSDRQLDALNRIVKGFRLDDKVREQYRTRKRVVVCG